MSIRRSLSSQRRRNSSLLVKKKQTAETNDLEETSPSELHLAAHSKLQVNEWIEQQSKIVSDELDKTNNFATITLPSIVEERLPPKWRPQVPIVYHRFDNPNSYNYDDRSYRIQEAGNELRESYRDKAKLSKTSRVVSLEKNFDSLIYIPPRPYGFCTDRSRILSGPRHIKFYVDCSMQELRIKVQGLKQWKPAKQKTERQSKGIKLTCKNKKA